MAEAVGVIEGVADDSWAPWAGRLVPNIVRRMKEDAENKARNEEEEKRQSERAAQVRREQEDADRVAREQLERAERRERRTNEKLDAFLANEITESDLERDSDAEEEEGRSAATRKEEVEDVMGTEASAMEVDDAGGDEGMAVDGALASSRRKRAPSSPPKPSNKRARAATTTQAKAAIVGTASVSCERCIRQHIVCIPSNGGARCANCKAKHLGCSLVPAKEVGESKGGASGAPRTKPVGGSRPKRQPKPKKEPAPKAGVARIVLCECAC